ncbi:GNAT family N-acetyltransferase [Dehalococcoidia bacterium]|nr:GNAT family N-acetyltransferase [Dehalococcoidia bacterium]MCL0070643.1 GNAT family N-acetyltransferase [Dehalococcoidia bacterium]MCL0088802.1 GNAT family N-acetyltransferase [Dehalococcoidia bacterium]MCL0092335.1 GNAT family N-acetyltransferase [Dehalococcoidia bacterium]
MEIIHAKTAEELAEIRQLFREYEKFLNVDLCFQNFEEELVRLPGKYAPPKGALLMAVEGQDVMGCVAVKELEDDVCEMKRLFVRPQHRGRGLGKLLAQRIIEEAARIGYSRMRLDTLHILTEAMRLYESLDFKRIDRYYSNPLPDVVYWELELRRRPEG